MSTQPTHDSPPKPRSRLKKFAFRLVRALVIAYLVAMFGTYFFQTYLVFPGMSRQGTADARVTPADGESLVHLKTKGGTPLTGLFGAAQPRHLPSEPRPSGSDPTPRPTILLFYGNGDAMPGAQPIAELFRSMSYHCMIIDYPGYGMSGGKPSEQGCYDAAEAATQYVLSRPDVDRTKLVAAGWSLGGAVAIDLAHRHRNDHTFCALMTFCTFTSVVDVGKEAYPFLPVSALLKHRFMSIEKVPDLTLPYFNAHGKCDNMIPFAHAARLAAAYGNPAQVTRFISDKASHNDFFDNDVSAREDAMQQFLARVTK